MTNLCEKAGQFMIEQINEAKSKEEDYKLACNQMNVTESGINSLKSILKNFSSLVDPFSKFIKEFNESIKKIYKNTPFNPYIDKIIYSQELILSELDTLNKEIVKLYSKTSAWNLIFQQAKEQKKLREEKKKKFEHYEQKLQKIEKDAKKKKNDELILRNEQKYRMAASEFVEISGSSLEIINNSLILSWNLINPIISELILTKTKAFNNIIFILNDFSNIKERFEEIKEEEKKENNIYNDYNNQKPNNRKNTMSLSVHFRRKGNKKEDNSENIKINTINMAVGKSTNSFGKIPLDRYQLFYQIEDEPY